MCRYLSHSIFNSYLDTPNNFLWCKYAGNNFTQSTLKRHYDIIYNSEAVLSCCILFIPIYILFSLIYCMCNHWYSERLCDVHEKMPYISSGTSPINNPSKYCFETHCLHFMYSTFLYIEHLWLYISMACYKAVQENYMLFTTFTAFPIMIWVISYDTLPVNFSR